MKLAGFGPAGSGFDGRFAEEPFFLTDDSCGGVCASCVFSERFSRGDNFDSEWCIFFY